MKKDIGKNMNKKASIFGWGVPVFIIAFIIFIFMTSNQISGQVKGQWETDFLQDSYLPAKQTLLKNNIVAKNIGAEIVWELANDGGFSKESECGKIFGKNLWNKEEQECFPPINTNSMGKAQEKLSRRNMPFIDVSFIDVSFFSTFFVGQSNVLPFKSKHGIYYHQNTFMVILEYSFEEYTLLIEQAQSLLSTCRDASDLKECLDLNKEDYWEYNLCDSTSEYTEADRKVAFCVVSPNIYVVQNGIKKEVVTYHFALDFTPSSPGEVTVFKATSTGKVLTIEFPQLLGAEKYSVYFTDHLNPTPGERKKSQQDVFFYEKDWKSVDLANPAENQEACDVPEKRVFDRLYLCQGSLVYVLEKPALTPLKYTITSWKKGKESVIARWGSIE